MFLLRNIYLNCVVTLLINVVSGGKSTENLYLITSITAHITIILE